MALIRGGAATSALGDSAAPGFSATGSVALGAAASAIGDSAAPGFSTTGDVALGAAASAIGNSATPGFSATGGVALGAAAAASGNSATPGFSATGDVALGAAAAAPGDSATPGFSTTGDVVLGAKTSTTGTGGAAESGLAGGGRSAGGAVSSLNKVRLGAFAAVGGACRARAMRAEICSFNCQVKNMALATINATTSRFMWGVHPRWRCPARPNPAPRAAPRATVP